MDFNSQWDFYVRNCEVFFLSHVSSLKNIPSLLLTLICYYVVIFVFLNTGGRKYGVIILVVVVGYGIIWMKVIVWFMGQIVLWYSHKNVLWYIFNQTKKWTILVVGWISLQFPLLILCCVWMCHVASSNCFPPYNLLSYIRHSTLLFPGMETSWYDVCYKA